VQASQELADLCNLLLLQKRAMRKRASECSWWLVVFGWWFLVIDIVVGCKQWFCL
jgi:hypothetical protein